MSSDNPSFMDTRRLRWRHIVPFVLQVALKVTIVSTFGDDNQTIYHLIGSGRTSEARSFAFQRISEDQSRKKQLRESYVNAFSYSFQRAESEYNFLYSIWASSCHQKRVYSRIIAKHDSDTDDCVSDRSTILHHATTTGKDLNTLWDESCSLFTASPAEPQSDQVFHLVEEVQPSHLCCEFRPGNWAYLRLPALHEPVLRFIIPRDELGLPPLELNLEQESFLRPFDVSTVVWPTGYLLSVCLGNWAGCPIPELHEVIQKQMLSVTSENEDNPFALELGTGIGAPSIALTRSILDYVQQIGGGWKHRTCTVASDNAAHSLALTITNACDNGLRDDFISTAFLDFTNMTSVHHLKDRMFPRAHGTSRSSDGFSLIFGSSLQTLFRDSDQSASLLWRVLDTLLDRTNPEATVLFAHARSDTIKVPQQLTLFEGRGCIVFDHMQTRDGLESDFEICVFRRTETTVRSQESHGLDEF